MGHHPPTEPNNSDRNSPFDPLELLQDLMPGELSPQEQQLVESLFGVMSPTNFAPPAIVPLEAQSDRDLLKHLQSQIHSANTIVDLLAQREIGRNHLSTMRQLELQIAAIAPNISDLEQVLEAQTAKPSKPSADLFAEPTNRPLFDSAPAPRSPTSNATSNTSLKAQRSGGTETHPSQSLKRIKAVQFWLNLRPRTRWAIFACLVAALGPVTIRWGGPRLIHQVEQTGFMQAFSHPTSTVKTIDGDTWMIEPPNQPIQSLQLAGIEPVDPHWIAEANSILRMIVSASNNQVSVTILPHSSRAILRLPTGLMLQEVLVREGFTKLDPKQLSSLPKDAVASLEQAQAKAELQHQNVWQNE